jgi:flavin reductase (DIM6/NTAB) family NADH-FMN oxidoreductase RutF
MADAGCTAGTAGVGRTAGAGGAAGAGDGAGTGSDGTEGTAGSGGAADTADTDGTARLGRSAGTAGVGGAAGTAGVGGAPSVAGAGPGAGGDGSMEDFFARLNPDMCVVTAVADGERAGCLVGFASQCSIRPPRFTVWLSKANHTYRVARAAQHLGVHLITRDQRNLAELLGGETGDEVDKFARLEWTEGYGGAVVLRNTAAWFVGTILHRTEGGDHVGFVLDPVQWGEGRPGPLLRLSDAAGIKAGHPVD